MPIPQNVYIDIASKVAGGAGPAQAFGGRVFTPNVAKLAPNTLFKANTAKDVYDKFGTGDEYDFALKYFSVITPSPAAKPNELQFFLHDPNASPAVTMTESWQAAQDISDSYGTCYFLGAAQVPAEIKACAQAISAENVKHILWVRAKKGSGTTELESLSDELIAIPSVGIALESQSPVDDEDLAFLPMGLQAAINWNAQNCTMNFMYRRNGNASPQVEDNTLRQKLDELRINYYGKTRRAGVDESFFQRGYLCGDNESLQDIMVHAGEQWLKARALQLLFDLQLSTRGIPANLDGIARGNSVMAQVKKEALYNGVIVRGKTLSVTQRIAITDLTGDDMAWATVQNDGSWSKCKIVEYTGPSGIAEYRLDYTLIYAKGDWVRKIVGSHNLI